MSPAGESVVQSSHPRLLPRVDHLLTPTTLSPRRQSSEALIPESWRISMNRSHRSFRETESSNLRLVCGKDTSDADSLCTTLCVFCIDPKHCEWSTVHIQSVYSVAFCFPSQGSWKINAFIFYVKTHPTSLQSGAAVKKKSPCWAIALLYMYRYNYRKKAKQKKNYYFKTECKTISIYCTNIKAYHFSCFLTMYLSPLWFYLYL